MSIMDMVRDRMTSERAMGSAAYRKAKLEDQLIREKRKLQENLAVERERKEVIS